MRAGGAAGGTGSQAAPFGSVAAALVGAPAGAILALGKGTFAEGVVLPVGITLWGACVGQTQLVPSTAGAATIDVVGPATVVRNLRIGGPRSGVLVAVAGASVDLEDVVVSGARSVGLFASGAVTVTGSRVVIRATLPRAVTDEFGMGIQAENGAQVDLKWLAVESNRFLGVLVKGKGTLLVVSDAVVRDTDPDSFGNYGLGIHCHTDARVEGHRLALERNSFAGVEAQLRGTVVLTDVVVRETRPGISQPDSGWGALCKDAGQLTLARAFFDRNQTSALVVGDPGSTAALEDVVLRDTLEQSKSRGIGTGIVCGGGSKTKGARLSLERNRRTGLTGIGVGTAIELEDVTVSRTAGLVAPLFSGAAFEIEEAAHLSLTRALIDESHCSGIVAAGAGTQLTLFDVIVRNTQPCLSNSRRGEGLILQQGVVATGTRMSFENNRAAGVLASEPGTRATLLDLQVRDTHGEMASGPMGAIFGEGLHVQFGAEVVLTRARIERSREVGVFAIAARVVGVDVVVRETLVSDCPLAQCGAPGGIGVAVVDTGSLALSKFSITNNAHLGVELAQGGTADLQAGEVSDNPIGVNAQTKDFDVARIQQDVIYRGNTVQLTSEILPIPQYNQLIK